MAQWWAGKGMDRRGRGSGGSQVQWDSGAGTVHHALSGNHAVQMESSLHTRGRPARLRSTETNTHQHQLIRTDAAGHWWNVWNAHLMLLVSTPVVDGRAKDFRDPDLRRSHARQPLSGYWILIKVNSGEEVSRRQRQLVKCHWKCRSGKCRSKSYGTPNRDYFGRILSHLNLVR